MPRNVDYSLPIFEVMDGINVHRLKTVNTFLPIWGYGSMFFGLEKKLNELKPDVVHAHGYGNFYTDKLVDMKSLCGCKFVLTVHGFAEGRGILKYPKILYDKIIGKKTICSYDGIIALSMHDKKIIKQMGVKRDNVFVVPNGFDATQFQKLPKPIEFKKRYNLSGRIILNISRLAVSKGQKYLVKAFSQLQSKHSDICLVIIGENWGEERNLQLMKAQLKLNDRMILTGIVSNEVVKEAFSSAEIFVLPSIEEGLPTVVLEAMSCGLPVVGTDVGGVAELIHDCGIVVESRSKREIMQGIEKLLKNTKLRNNLSKLGKIKSEQYKWDIISKKITDVYNKILNREL